LGGRLSVHEQLFCATAPRRPQRGAGDSPSPVLVSARTCSCRSHFRRGVLRHDLRWQCGCGQRRAGRSGRERV